MLYQRSFGFGTVFGVELSDVWAAVGAAGVGSGFGDLMEGLPSWHGFYLYVFLIEEQADSKPPVLALFGFGRFWRPLADFT